MFAWPKKKEPQCCRPHWHFHSKQTKAENFWDFSWVFLWGEGRVSPVGAAKWLGDNVHFSGTNATATATATATMLICSSCRLVLPSASCFLVFVFSFFFPKRRLLDGKKSILRGSSLGQSHKLPHPWGAIEKYVRLPPPTLGLSFRVFVLGWQQCP